MRPGLPLRLSSWPYHLKLLSGNADIAENLRHALFPLVII